MKADASGRLVRAGGALLALALTTAACSPLDDAMVAIFGRGMRTSVSFDPYENPHLPAENAVSFSSGNYPPNPDVLANLGQPRAMKPDMPPPMAPADMGPPGADHVRLLENPVEADSASLARGEELYIRNCAVCHGEDGVSATSPMVQDVPQMALMNAYDLATGNSRQYTDGYIYGMIRIGRGVMPAYGHRITHFDRWRIVNYVRQLQAEAGGPPEGGPAGDGGDAAGEGG